MQNRTILILQNESPGQPSSFTSTHSIKLRFLTPYIAEHCIALHRVSGKGAVISSTVYRQACSRECKGKPVGYLGQNAGAEPDVQLGIADEALSQQAV